MILKGKNAVVTGATSGLGKAIARALIEKGATVYALGRNVEKLSSAREELGELYIPVELDISHVKTVFEWIDKTFSAERIPHILINNAGAGLFAKIDAISLEDWHAMVNTNINGLFYMTSGLVPRMKKNRGGAHIINIGSILGKTTRSEGSAYSLTKYAVQGFSESLFKELRSDNIKVTCINPGSISTRFFETSGIEPNDHMLHPGEVADVIIHVLQSPENVLIDELTLRPLNPRRP